MTWEILLTPAGDQVSYVGLALILFNLFGYGYADLCRSVQIYADLCRLCFHQVFTVPDPVTMMHLQAPRCGWHAWRVQGTEDGYSQWPI